MMGKKNSDIRILEKHTDFWDLPFDTHIKNAIIMVVFLCAIPLVIVILFFSYLLVKVEIRCDTYRSDKDDRNKRKVDRV